MKRINLLAAVGLATVTLAGVSTSATAQDRDDYQHHHLWDVNHDGRIDWRDRRILERRWEHREDREYRYDRRYGEHCWYEMRGGYSTRVCN
jgi:hypothetical protein